MGSSEQTSTLEELSARVAENAAILGDFYKSSSYPEPSFGRHSPMNTLPTTAPQNVHIARQALVDASLRLSQLATGPTEFLPNLAVSYQYLACLRWLCQFRIFQLVPLEGSVRYAELATAANLPEQRLKSVLRMVMTANLFLEMRPEEVSHSATSALLTENPNLYAWAVYMCETSAPTATKMRDASLAWPHGLAKNQTAYNLAHDTDLPFFDHMALDAEKEKQFAKYMKHVTSSEGTHIKHALQGFDWASLGKAIVVDVGGSTGNASINLAESFPELEFVVQDLPSNATEGHSSLARYPKAVSSRITFQGHNFFEAQPYKGADVYFLRMILHDWPKEQATTILKNIVAALKPSSRILIMDSVLPAPGTTLSSVERLMRVRDLTMWQTFNSMERDLVIWNELLAAVDGRLKMVNVIKPFGSVMSVMEIVLDI